MSLRVSTSEIESHDWLHSKRLVSIDLWRGLVMVLMALDHTRDFFSNVHFSPTDVTQTNVPLFLSRWITHFCAPSFIFLAGIAAYLSHKRRQNKKQLSKFLFIRGLWLVFLELTVVRFGWIFDPTYSFSSAGVLWAIGWSMVVLAVLIYLPTRAIATIGILLIFGHNLFDHVQGKQLGEWDWLWAVLHQPEMLTLFPGKSFIIVYTLIPWIGVMATGYAFGTIFSVEKSQRLQLLRRLGLSLIFAFIILRAKNIYGDPDPWSIQPTFSHTLLSFINCQKYPPSLLYLLMTLGPAILILYLFERQRFRFLKPLLVFGQVPLFFYIVHIWLIHLFTILLALPHYGLKAIFLPYIISSFKPTDYGYNLPTIYSFWLILIILLYPVCNWYANYKKTHQNKWLNFL
ncbi:MAG: heparan-alpha-glucosaminide N-acetyltransferase domain-containing protein [Rhizonema sp. PD38]|nr:heparan-alpha-glucosaminide N-acetyltransferase domain-containing protein [Rhizonema sp. PD38]